MVRESVEAIETMLGKVKRRKERDDGKKGRSRASKSKTVEDLKGRRNRVKPNGTRKMEIRLQRMLLTRKSLVFIHFALART